MPAVAADRHQLYSRKRRRSVVEEEQLATTTRSTVPPWKWVKRPFGSQQEAIAAFWDSLSKQWLTRGALKELNRRNGRRDGPAITAPEGRLSLAVHSVGQVKCFARQGGPDLCDLKGVRQAHARYL